MINPLNTYVLNIYDHFLDDVFKRASAYFFFAHRWFHVFLSNPKILFTLNYLFAHR